MITRVAASALRGSRWDPGYWNPRLQDPLRGLSPLFPVHSLGEFIAFITYGPVVTGIPLLPHLGGVPVLTGTAFLPFGLDPAAVTPVVEGGPHDIPRSRLQPGDLLLPRSGAGSLGKGRMAVWEGNGPANVGCFVDILRLSSLNPHYGVAFLKSRFGWNQLQRLWNGVGTPNISFAEIRALRIAVPSLLDQARVEEAFRTQVGPSLREVLGLPPTERKSALHRLEQAGSEWVMGVEAWLQSGEMPAGMAVPFSS